MKKLLRMSSRRTFMLTYVTVKARGCLSRLYDHGLNCDAARESGQDAYRGEVHWVDLEAVNQAAPATRRKK